MKNQAPVTIPLTLTDYSIHPLHHLIPPSILLLEHNQRWLLPLVLCAIGMVIRRSSAFGMVLGFVLIATRWDTQYTIAMFFIETSNTLILIYCTV